MVVPRDAWDWTRVPEHLRPTFRVVDDEGREQARGKDLEGLKAPLRPKFAEAIASVAADTGRAATGQTSWTFGTVEESFTHTRAGHEVRGYPALTDEGATVGLGVFGSDDEAAARHRLGVVRLLTLALRPPKVDDLGLDQRQKLALAGTPYPTVAALLDDLARADVVDVVDARPLPRTEQEYDALLAAVRAGHDDRLRAGVRDLFRTLESWRAADKALSGRAEMSTLPALTDLRRRSPGW